MADKIEDLEGIGEKRGETLRQAGITTPAKLLAAGASRSGRKALAEKTGLEEKSILKWVNLADLCRIKGVSTQYSELLEAAGVDTIKELATRNTENLTAKMAEVNKSKKLARQIPAAKSVANWIEQAKCLPATVTH